MLRIITGIPWNVTNKTLHRDLCVKTLSAEVTDTCHD